SRAQRYVFFSERKVWKIADVPEHTPVLPIRKVGVIGAGTMGGGISMNFLNAGIPVTIVEAAQEALERGVATIRRNYDNTAKKGRMAAADVEARMRLLSPGIDLGVLSDCDLVIEAVYEDMVIKQDVFRKLDRIAKKDAILASNTSYLNIDEIAGVTRRPGKLSRLEFLSARQRHAPARSRARRQDGQADDRHRDAACQENRQGRRGGRRLPRLCRQSHAASAPARGAKAYPRGRHALG